MTTVNRGRARVLTSRPRWNKASLTEKVEAHTTYGRELFQEDNRPRNARGLLKEMLRRQDEDGEWERQCRTCGDFMPECEVFFERTNGRLRWNCRDCCTLRNAPALKRRDGDRISKLNRRARSKNAEGKITKADIERHWKQQGGKCYWCGCPLNTEGAHGSPTGKFHVDHYIPLAKGGSNLPTNIVLSCPTCNSSKGARAPEIFRALKRKQLAGTISVSSQE